MRLRTKILVILGASLVIHSGVAAFVLRYVLDPTLTRFEHAYAQRDAEVCRNVLRSEATRISELASDWARWDDAYRFLATGDPEFVRHNFEIPILRDNRLEFVFILDGRREVVFSQVEDFETGDEFAIAGLPEQRWPENHALFGVVDDRQGRGGLWDTGSGVAALAVWPILPTDRSGTPRGVVVLGRVLDEAARDRLAARSGSECAVYPADAAPRPDAGRRIDPSRGFTLPMPRLSGVMPETTGDFPVECYRDDDDHLRVLGNVEDIAGRNNLVLTTRVSRVILHSGLRTSGMLFVLFVAMAIVTTVVLLVALSVMVTRPINRLMKHLLVTRSGDYLTARLDLGSRDEVGQLGSEFNRMLERLQRDHEKRLEAERELRRSEERYRDLSIHDDLTGLYNTRYLYDSLERLFEASERDGRPFSLLFIDIDRFKIVVDTYGHLHGSQAIAEVAGILRDTLEPPAYGVAYGGDEYVLVLPGYDKAASLGKAEEIRARISDTVFLTERDLHVRLTVSIGAANYPEDARDMTGLLALADAALFYVKGRGKNSVGDGAEAAKRSD